MARQPLVWKTLLLLVLTAYTALSAGPFIWVAMMSVRTTAEINLDPYALPQDLHWDKYLTAWSRSHYDVYFWNSVVIVSSAVLLTTVIGAMAAHALARYRFRGRTLIFLILFSTVLLPPQLTIISLFQILIDYGLINTRTGLVLVYMSLQLPLTIYILESFFAQMPQDLFDAARMDGYSSYEIFWRLTVPIGLPAISTTVILNFISLWNEFLYAVVLVTDDSKRTLPMGIQRFFSDQGTDIGMVATGLMIAILPVIAIYVFFSEQLVKGMTAGAIR